MTERSFIGLCGSRAAQPAGATTHRAERAAVDPGTASDAETLHRTHDALALATAEVEVEVEVERLYARWAELEERQA